MANSSAAMRRAGIWAGLLLIVGLLGGCVDPAKPAAGPTGGIHSAADCAGKGGLAEWDIYISESHYMEPTTNQFLIAFAFGLSPNGPFTVPGPELRVKQCDTVVVRLHDPATSFPGHTIHWHGLSLPWTMDGVPFMTQTVSPPGVAGVFTYTFVAWESGTYWYHCHVEAPVHVDLGLFGAFIVEPLDARQDKPFDREHTLIMHEYDSQVFLPFDYLNQGRRPSPDDLRENPMDAGEGVESAARTTVDLVGFITEATTGVETWSEGPRDYYPLESLRYRPKYDVFMLNGKSFPETEVLHTQTGDVLRIRLINAGQLVHTMHLHGHHFLVTHKDGYNLPAPYWADTLLIGPAERYDVYVTSNNAGLWDLHDHGGGWNVGGYTSNDYAFPGGMNTMLVYDDLADVELPSPTTARSGDYMVFAATYKGSAGGHKHG
jgi:manganese oxidase